MKYKKTITVIISLALCSVSQTILAQDKEAGNIQIGIFGNPGISGAYGQYPSDYNATPDFSFSAGARVRINQAFAKNMLLAFDCGFLEIGYGGTVAATRTYFYTSYDFLTFNALAGLQFGTGYFCGGFFYAKSLGGDQYREYTESWVSLDQKDDIGLVTELGKDLGKYFTIGIQGRLGLSSIGESVDIKTWAVHGKLGINIFTIGE